MPLNQGMRVKVFAAVCLVAVSCVGLNPAAAQNQDQQNQDQEITVAAASDLSFVLQDLAAQFQQRTGTRVKLSFGSSGNFFAQIQNGAPYDLFFSADIEYPQRLEQAGLTVPGSLYRYATGKLVLWVRSESSALASRRFPSAPPLRRSVRRTPPGWLRRRIRRLRQPTPGRRRKSRPGYASWGLSRRFS